MSTYKILPTNTRPMPLQVSSEVFVDEWRSCWRDKTKDISYLLELSQPWINHWERMLTTPSYPKDINYITLCRRLSYDPIVALDKISYWVEEIKTSSTIQHELEYMVLDHVRRTKYSPNYAKSPMIAEYVIALDYKLRLKDQIKKAKPPKLEYTDDNEVLNQQAVTDNHPDHLLLLNLGLDQWESYLFQLTRYGQTTLQMAHTTGISRETFYYEEKKIWQQLNMKLQETSV